MIIWPWAMPPLAGAGLPIPGKIAMIRKKCKYIKMTYDKYAGLKKS